MRTSIRTFTACAAAFLLLASFAGSSAQVAEVESSALGNHVKVHFRMLGALMMPTPVIAVESGAGDLLLLAYVDDGRLYASDGADAAGDRPYLPVDDRWIGHIWHRLDVVLHGDTYTLHLDQIASVTGRTFAHATEGTWVSDPRPLGPSPYFEEVRWDRHRADASGMAYEDTFTSETRTWEKVGAPERFARQPGVGYRSPGQLEMQHAPLFEVAYLRAPTAGADGVFTAEVAVNVVSNILRPDGMVALAGVAGPADAPSVQWSVLIARPPLSWNEWTFYLVTPEGQRAPIAPAWGETGWHALRVQVDEPQGRLVVHVDDAAPQTFDMNVGSSTHVAIGDVEPGLGSLDRGATIYDEAALYVEAN